MKPLATKVRITSSGMMDYRADYDLPNGKVTPFELTLKKEHLDDLLSTLRVRGDLQIPQPITFSATNSEETKLAIAAANPIDSLISGMPGARITLRTVKDGEVTGRNMGMDKVNTILDGDRVIQERFLTVLEGTRVRRFSLGAIMDFGFADEVDQQEVSKALDKLNDTIRPGTTLVRFGLQGKGAEGGTTRAALKWVEPDAAPLMTYRLSITKDAKFILEGWVTIHNFTNQPWEGTTVEMVTGQPHTFKGFSGEAVQPIREERRLVDAKAIGGRTVSAGMGPQGAQGIARSLSKRALGGGNLQAAAMSFAAPQMAGALHSDELESVNLGAPDLEEADIHDQGGMQRLVCPSPVALLEAKKSTMVFMFSRELPEANTVLHYREEFGAKPDRAFRLKNTIGISLPKGPIAVDMDTPCDPKKPDGPVEDMGMGKTIFEATQPNEDRMVVYATDMNVKVYASRKKVTSRTLGVSLKGGVGYTNIEDRGTTEYRVVNVGDEDVVMYLDHRRSIAGSEAVATGGNAHDHESLVDGHFRSKIKVPPHSDFTVEVGEVRRHVDQVALSVPGQVTRAGGIVTVIGHSKDKLRENAAVQAVLLIAEKIDDKNKEIKATAAKASKLNAQHQRAKSTLESLKDQDAQARAEFVTEVTGAHHSLKAVEDTEMPRLNEQLASLESDYNTAIKALVASWDAENKEVAPAK